MTPEGRNQLVADEGTKLKLYDDKTGQYVARLPSGGNPTIGIGRNLATRGLTRDETTMLFENDVTAIEGQLSDLLPWLKDLDGVRHDVVVMVEFNTGNVLAFRKMLAHLHAKQYDDAAAELLNSAAARSLPARYERMGKALQDGAWE